MDRKEPGPLFEGLGETFRGVGPYLTMGIQLGGAVVGFFFIGYWLDGMFATKPVLSLAGVALGTTGGLIKFFRTVRQMDKQDGAAATRHHED